MTHAITNEQQCTGGSAKFLDAMLPWHIRYRSFAGTLPNITRIDVGLVNAAVFMQIGTVACLYLSVTGVPLVGNIARNTSTGVAESLSFEVINSIPKSSGSASCSQAILLKESTTSFKILREFTTKLTVTLVQ